MVAGGSGRATNCTTNVPSDFLVDTNILVYVYDTTDAAKQRRAIAVLDQLRLRRSGALSTQILGEYFVTVTRKIPVPLMPARAERSITNYVRSWTVYDLTPLVVLEALRGVQRYQFSYWDGLIWATAKLNGVPNVLSEDFSNGAMLDGVRFLNPLLPTFDLIRLQSQ
jgi:predicted nucleic acid-binding protein